MSSDPGRPATIYRVAQGVLLTIALIGGGVLAWSLILSHRQDSSPALVPPEPSWLSKTSRKADFTALITSGKQEEGKALLDRVAGRARIYSGISSAESKWRMTRILSRGYEFDSQLYLTAQPRSSEWTDMELRVDRPGSEALFYRAEVGDRGLGKLQYASQPSDQGAANDSYKDVTVAPDTPLGIGDLRVRDVIDLYASLRARRVRYLGTLETYNSLPLRVFETPLGTQETAANGQTDGGKDYQGHATSALIYCEPVDLNPRTIRFFDHADRLVRTYSSFVFSPANPGEPGDRLQLTSFQVDSIPTDSNTMFRLESVQLRRDDRGLTQSRH